MRHDSPAHVVWFFGWLALVAAALLAGMTHHWVLAFLALVAYAVVFFVGAMSFRDDA